jgi:hypothetical protein
MKDPQQYVDMIQGFNPSAYIAKPVNYPISDKYIYETYLETINFDDERVNDINRNKAFVVGPTQDIEKDIKSIDSIFSSRFGSTLKDLNPYIDKCKCECGYLKSSINLNVTCPNCNTKVRYVDDDFEYGAYIVLKEHFIIHPNFYKKLDFVFGRNVLENIIKYEDAKDQDGHIIKNKVSKGHEKDPFFGIGMIDFYERFDEILDYYTNKKKEDYILELKENRDKIFTHSIFVYTTHLRPIDTSASGGLAYESTNDKYYMMSKLVTEINDCSTMTRRNKKPKNQLLFDLQMKQMSLYEELVKIVSGKKGSFRAAFGGRCNFTGRNVIIQNASLDIDQITLSYYSLVELLQQRLINILKKCYNMTYSDAYRMWYMANLVPDPNVIRIINTLIKSSPYGLGLPVLINRNPTIAFGGILQMFIVGMTFDHTMGVPLRTLKLYKGDFDGDVNNMHLIINKDFLEMAFMIFNPRNSMMISRNDGKFNPNTENQRDTIINANTIMRLSRHRYTQEELNVINNIQGRLK